MNEELVTELKEEQQKNFEAIPVKSENLLWKTAKLGVFYALTGMTLKKFKSTKDYSDLIAFGSVAGTTLLNTGEQEKYSDDFVSLGALLATVSGYKGARQLLNNSEIFDKAYKYADNFDETVKTAKVFVPEVWNKTIESISSGTMQKTAQRIAEIKAKEIETGEELGNIGFFFKSTFSFAKSAGETIFETFASGFNQVLDKKLGIFNDVVGKSEYGQFLKTLEENPELSSFLKTIKRDPLGDIGLNDKQGLSGTEEFFANNRLTKNFLALIYGGNEKTVIQDIISNEKHMEEAQKQIRKFQKYNRIKETSFFKDFLGEYTEYSNGVKTANVGKILNDNNVSL